MLFFEALKLGYLIHLHPLDNAHAEHTTQKSPVSLSTCRTFTAEREGFEPITLTAYISATLLSKFQIGNETVTIFNR